MNSNDTIVGRNPVMDRLMSRIAHQLHLIEEDGVTVEALDELKRRGKALWSATGLVLDPYVAEGSHRCWLQMRHELERFIIDCKDARCRHRTEQEPRMVRLHRHFAEFVRWYQRFQRLERRELVMSMNCGA